MAAPFVYSRSSVDGNSQAALLKAALDGDLDRIKGIVRKLGIGNGDQAAALSFHKDGFGVMHCAACQGHLEVCKYLVEELGSDPNMAGDGGPFEGVTPFMSAAQSGDVSTVKYLLDHGADLMKADTKGRTVLHHAVCAGSCKVTEFLLLKGIPVDIDCGHGTPLYQASINEQDKTVKILLDHHANPNTIFCGIGTPLNGALIYRSLKCMKLLIKAGADVNGKGSIASPLVFATGHGGYTNFVQLLLKAGADPNIPDDLGRLPIELAASRDCKEEVEMLFPLTSPIPSVPNWSVDGIMSHAKLENEKPLNEEHMKVRRSMMKSQADKAFRRKEYAMASKFYTEVINQAPSSTLYSNRSLCKLKLGDGEGALSDAYQCRMIRPDWAKACYRQAAAHMLLKEYKQACDALLDAQKLDPGNEEIEQELGKAMELMKIAADENEQ
uniref:Serine/threonine-protein kinase BSK1-like TPR repeats domain-containing protein n=1 Tax=Arundo donax TaxID=35708 RepID=A0A0A9H1R3_ARUDO